MKPTSPQRKLLEDQGDQFKFGTHAGSRVQTTKGPKKRFKGKKEIESEDLHGGETSSSGQFPTDTLERSQSRRGSSDLYQHPDDPGQGGVKS